jgi:hypothetical protein
VGRFSDICPYGLQSGVKLDKNVTTRSFEKVEHADLRRLLDLATEDRDEFFARHPRWKKLYSKRILCIALCQGAAQHYVDGKTGVKDFDVWTFYAEHPEGQYPYRRMGHKDSRRF